MGQTVDLFGNWGGMLHEAIREVAATESVAWDSSTGAAIVFRHRDVAGLARDDRLAGIGLALFDLMGIADGPLRDWYSGLMFTNEGATHRRLRSLVARAFTPRAAEALRHTAAALAGDAMARPLGPDCPDDLVERFALVPIRVMCHLLGVPDSDVGRFAAWLDDLARVSVLMSPHEIAHATAAIVELLGYIDALTRRRREDPEPDLLTALLAAEDDGERLTHDEVVGMVANLLLAGQDTTRSQLGCSLLVLLADPDGREQARSDDALLSHLESETIRLEPAIPALPRTSTAPLKIDGSAIPAGSMVMLCSATANRVPGHLEGPRPVRRQTVRRSRRTAAPHVRGRPALLPGSRPRPGHARGMPAGRPCRRSLVRTHGSTRQDSVAKRRRPVAGPPACDTDPRLSRRRPPNQRGLGQAIERIGD